MSHPYPSSTPNPSPPRSGNWFTRGGWWFLVHGLTFGALSTIPFVHAYVLSKRALHAILAVVFALVTVASLVVGGFAEEDARGTPTGPLADLGFGVFFAMFLVGFIVIAVVRQQVYGRGGAANPVAPQPAVARAMQARKRRAEARDLVGTDPLLARELRIGRPDLPREYDDGGLVDLNSAPAQVVADVCGLEPAQAARIVQARQAATRFAAVDDVFAWTDLPVDTWDRIRDRAVVL